MVKYTISFCVLAQTGHTKQEIKHKEKLQHKTLKYRTLVKYRAPGG